LGKARLQFKKPLDPSRLTIIEPLLRATIWCQTFEFKGSYHPSDPSNSQTIQNLLIYRLLQRDLHLVAFAAIG